MKTMPLLLMALGWGLAPTVLLAQETGDDQRALVPEMREGGVWIVGAKGAVPRPKLFFSASSEARATVSPEKVTQAIDLEFTVLQGKPEVLTLALHGDGEITEVRGEAVGYWAVRRSTDEAMRFLEIRPKEEVLQIEKGEDPAPFRVRVSSQTELEPGVGEVNLLTLGPGAAVGYAGRLDVRAEESVAVTVAEQVGWTSVVLAEDEPDLQRWVTSQSNRLRLAVEPKGVRARPIELSSLRLDGEVDEAAQCVRFLMVGRVQVRDPDGGTLKILSGHAALRELPQGGAYRVRLEAPEEGSPYYALEFAQPGDYPIQLAFDAQLRRQGEWQMMDFRVPANAIVPMRLTGFPEAVRFDGNRAVFPTLSEGARVGFLPPSGRATTAWRPGRTEARGKLFFASSEKTEISVGAGLLRQSIALEIQVLQGSLSEMSVDLVGDGEILAVEGPHVLGWSIEEGEEGVRRLVIPVSQAWEGAATLRIRSQTPVGEFPVTVRPIRLAPVGSVRHAGSLRVGNQGAVRLSMMAVQGMTQLSPNQFPGAVELTQEAGQVYVYRLPSAGYAYEIQAEQILPEVNVSQIAVYHMGESERRLEAAIELDVREAPLREWEMRIPADYAVVSVQGAEVSDYLVGTPSEGESAVPLTVLFAQLISGRHVLNVQLEKSEASAAGDWALPALLYPEANSVRGHVGVTATAGFRLTTGSAEQLSEVPLPQFPLQRENLQQAYRLRDPNWTATIAVEALGQSVQADVFHLYSLKEGMVYGSVLVNYFVVGAPVSAWRLQVPEAVGNVGVDGEDVQTWRREGEQLEVILHEPALGPSALLLTFELPMNVSGGALTLADVVPLEVQGERGFVQVVSPYQVQLDVTEASANLLSLEATELPAEFRLLTSAPSLAAFQYGSRPVALTMDVQWFDPGSTVDQVVDYASLSSEISRDGQVATEMRLHVKSRGRQALRLQLPEGATLWDVRVDGEAINARVDGESIVVPLTASGDPNQHILVVVRLGQAGVNPTQPRLAAPALSVPMMISEWSVRSERGRLLVPQGKAAVALAVPSLTETGFEWLRRRGHGGWAAWIAGLAIMAGWLGRRARSRWLPIVSGVVLLVAVIGCASLAVRALDDRRVNLQGVEVISPVVTPGEPLTVAFSQVPRWRAMVHPGGLLAGLLGLGLCLGSRRAKAMPVRRLGGMIGGVLLGLGLLAQRLGAPLFLGSLGVWLLAVWVVGCLRVWRVNQTAWQQAKAAREAEASREETDDPPPASPAPLTPLWLVGALGWALFQASASPVAAERVTGDRLVQTWRIEETRLFGELEVTLSGAPGDRMELLRAPAVLTSFEGGEDRVRVARRVVSDGVCYDLILLEEGVVEVSVAFELPLPQPLSGFSFPTGQAAFHELKVAVERPGWEIRSPAAVRTEEGEAGEGRSEVTMLLGLAGEQRLDLTPRKRDLSAESSQFYVEVDQVFIPRPGVVDGRHRVSVRPSQGRVRELTFAVPTGFTVSEVLHDAIRNWRFDPETGEVRVVLESPQAEPFQLLVLTQQGMGNLPAQAVVEPLRVNGSAGEVGVLALAFGADAQPGEIDPQGLSVVNSKDFDGSLLAAAEGEEAPSLTLHRVFRYGRDTARVEVQVTAVAPEVRVETRQTLSLGEERLVLSVDMKVRVTRAGLFQLRFALPDGLEVEAIRGSHLDHWSETVEADQRVVILHLNGRSLGELSFALTLTGTSPQAQLNWQVPRLALENVARSTGQMVIVPELGIRLQAVARRNVSQLDTRRLARRQPGTLAFQLLQDDWQLDLRVEALEPWVTAQALREVTLREGQTRTRLAIHYQIENAAVKALRLTLPGLDAAAESSVHAVGEAISDLVRVPEEEDLWEIRFQRGMLGKVLVTIDYQQAADRDVAVESLAPIQLSKVRQATHWLAVRSAGRLEVTLEEADRRWQAVDWTTVPSELVNERQPQLPQLCVRAVAPDQPLNVRVERHAVAEALKLRVAQGRLRTILSAAGKQVTKVSLAVEVAEKSPLRVRLPREAVLFNAFVNGQSVALVEEEGTVPSYLFYVFPREDTRQAEVTFAYGLYNDAATASIGILGPSMELPLQDITWEVVLPNGYTLKDHSGDLNLQEARKKVRFQVEQYLAVHDEMRAEQAQSAKTLLEKANLWLQEGQQDKALEALQNAANSASLDAASNEDARTQLRQLQREQAVLGLNTRRQWLALENKIETPAFARNEQLEEAANENPLLRGQLNYDPQQVDALLRGNTAEENSALKRMAGRLVSQQSEAEPGMRGIGLTLPARGELLTFRRGVQVERATPLTIEVELTPQRSVPSGAVVVAAVFLLGLAFVGAGWRSLPRGPEQG